MAAVHRVAIVVASAIGVELAELADDRHVWALRVPEYERVAQERWSTDRDDLLDSGITLFNGNGLSPEAELLHLLATIEEHHGAYSHTPALGEIEVLGAQPTAEVLAQLNAYGYDEISPSQRGFTARRDA